MNILIAPNAFKGSLTALEAARAMETGIRRFLPEANTTLLPVADGGDGTLAVLVPHTGGQIFAVNTADPLGRPVQAQAGFLGDGHTAVIELAAASGLRLLKPEERNPLLATTYGTGQLIRAALDRGCTRLLIGPGGSATVDGGVGILQALGVRLLDAAGHDLPPGGGALANLNTIDVTGMDARLRQVEIVVLCDVNNPLAGETGAAKIFGPQKGATPEMAALLDANLTHFARVLLQSTGRDVLSVPGGGAAGGVSAGLAAVLGARLASGIEFILDTLNFDAALAGVDLVMTGEGRLDDQTIQGKAPIGVARRARQRGIPVVALAGSIHGQAVYEHGIDAMLAIVPGPMSLENAMHQAAELLADAAERTLRLIQIRINKRKFFQS